MQNIKISNTTTSWTSVNDNSDYAVGDAVYIQNLSPVALYVITSDSEPDADSTNGFYVGEKGSFISTFTITSGDNEVYIRPVTYGHTVMLALGDIS